jgi:glycosyltransferase involved in cell wall biosynthesis
MKLQTIPAAVPEAPFRATRPLRIVIDARCILPQEDGLGTYARNLLAELAKVAAPHRLLALVQPEAREELLHLQESPRVELVPLAAPSMRLSQQLRVPWKLAELRPDVYHYLVHDLPFLHRVPSLLTFQDLNFILFPEYYGKFSRLKRAYSRIIVALALRRARQVIVPSQATRKALLERWPGIESRLSVIGYGVHPRFRQPASSERLDSVLGRYRLKPGGYFFFLGTDRPHKNLPRLVSAFESLPEEVRLRAQLVLAGAHRYSTSAGPSLAGPAGTVRLGYVPADDLPALYRGALAVVLPSFAEGFGLPALEAMASAGAVIVSQKGALAEVVGEAGLLVDPHSTDSIRGAMEVAARHPEIRERLSRAGRARAKSFSFAETARRTLELYERVAGAEG